MINRIRNGVRARLPKIDVPAFPVKIEIARILKDEGNIANYRSSTTGRQGAIRVFLKYGPGWSGSSTDLQRVSVRCRIYCGRARSHASTGASASHPGPPPGGHDRPRGREDRGGGEILWQRLVGAHDVRVGRQGLVCPRAQGFGLRDGARGAGPKGSSPPRCPQIRSASRGGAVLPALSDERQLRPSTGWRGRWPRTRSGRDRGLQPGPRHRGVG